MGVWPKIAIAIIVAEIIVSLFPQLFTKYSSTAIDLSNRLAPPSTQHILGTDSLGRDVFTRLLYAIRYSLAVAALSLAIAFSLGVVLGGLSAIAGGYIDSALSILFNTIYTIPGLFTAAAISIVVGPNVIGASIAIGLSLAPIFYRFSRSAAKEILTKPYIEAAKALGASTSWIITRYIVWELAKPLLTTSIYLLSDAIAFEASLSILGLGVQPPTPTLGNMIAEYREYIFTAPYLLLAPVTVIAITISSLNTLANKLLSNPIEVP
ncbi:MAG: ABC transporter permease [Ignisphaera sp.]